MTGYLPAHPFEPYRESDSYCGFPDPDNTVRVLYRDVTYGPMVEVER